MKEKTINDFIAKDNKDTPFEERARKWEEEIKPICEKWGIAPWAGLQSDTNSIVCLPLLKDTWASSGE